MLTSPFPVIPSRTLSSLPPMSHNPSSAGLKGAVENEALCGNRAFLRYPYPTPLPQSQSYLHPYHNPHA